MGRINPLINHKNNNEKRVFIQARYEYYYMKSFYLLIFACVLSSCVFYPKVSESEGKCETISKKFDLKKNFEIEGELSDIPSGIGETVVSVKDVLTSCDNEACVVILLGAVGLVASSYVVSGSFVVIGNTLNWTERTVTCKRIP